MLSLFGNLSQVALVGIVLWLSPNVAPSAAATWPDEELVYYSVSSVEDGIDAPTTKMSLRQIIAHTVDPLAAPIFVHIGQGVGASDRLELLRKGVSADARIGLRLWLPSLLEVEQALDWTFSSASPVRWLSVSELRSEGRAIVPSEIEALRLSHLLASTVSRRDLPLELLDLTDLVVPIDDLSRSVAQWVTSRAPIQRVILGSWSQLASDGEIVIDRLPAVSQLHLATLGIYAFAGDSFEDARLSVAGNRLRFSLDALTYREGPDALTIGTFAGEVPVGARVSVSELMSLAHGVGIQEVRVHAAKLDGLDAEVRAPATKFCFSECTFDIEESASVLGLPVLGLELLPRSRLTASDVEVIARFRPEGTLRVTGVDPRLDLGLWGALATSNPRRLSLLTRDSGTVTEFMGRVRDIKRLEAIDLPLYDVSDPKWIGRTLNALSQHPHVRTVSVNSLKVDVDGLPGVPTDAPGRVIRLLTAWRGEHSSKRIGASDAPGLSFVVD